MTGTRPPVAKAPGSHPAPGGDPPPAWKVRKLGPEDARLISDFTVAAFSVPRRRVAVLPPPTGAAAETPAAVQAQFSRGVTFWALEVGNTGPAAMLRVEASHGTEGRPVWMLERIGVLPEQRGRGYGALLIHHVEQEAQAAGVARLALHCVVERLMVPYYSRLGFHVVRLFPHESKPLTIARMEKKTGAAERPKLAPALGQAPAAAPGENPGTSPHLPGGPDPARRPLEIPLLPWRILPSGGLYVVWLWVPEPATVQIGGLGTVPVGPGLYGYVGSARTSLHSRVRRHWEGLGINRPRWHIDRLRRWAIPVAVDFVPAGPGSSGQIPLSECQLAQALQAGGSAHVAISRFGAGDCRCPGHLIRAEPESPAYAMPRSLVPSLLCLHRPESLPAGSASPPR